MESYLAANIKNDYQQSYRRFEEKYDLGTAAHDALKRAKASRLWMLGVVALIFSMSSDFFLGTAAGLFGVYVYQIVASYMQKAQAEDAMEEIERWFGQNNLRVQDKTPFFKADEQLQQPLDLFDEGLYR